MYIQHPMIEDGCNGGAPEHQFDTIPGARTPIRHKTRRPNASEGPVAESGRMPHGSVRGQQSTSRLTRRYERCLTPIRHFSLILFFFTFMLLMFPGY